jgi:predicted phage tail protein
LVLQQWCNDPAWVLWDLLSSTRYGLGEHLDVAQLDKWSFFAASQYASELIPDGFGGLEPRFSCNVNIQTSEEAYKLINDMCSVYSAPCRIGRLVR